MIPMYRHLWPHVKDSLPKKGRKTDDLAGGMPELPKELEAALLSLYGNYEKYYEAWRGAADAAGEGALLTPPVFIVVCNNTNVSKLVFDWIAGWEQTIGAGSDAMTRDRAGQPRALQQRGARSVDATAPTPSSSTPRSSSPARR